jgi:hypothetical protein
MSFITALESALVARAQSDGTLVNLLGGAGAPRFTILWGAVTLPGAFVVCRAEETDPTDSFDKRSTNYTVTFDIFDSSDNGVTNCQAIMVRLLGDWPVQSNRQPSFGFDRWVPDVSSAGWNAGSGMIKRGTTTAHEKDEMHYTIRLEGNATFG